MTWRPRRPVGLLAVLSVGLLLVLVPLARALATSAPRTDTVGVTSAVRGPSTARVTPVQWCGGDRLGTDRAPDLLGGNLVHVVYAMPADGVDQFGTYASRIVTDIAAIDAWWRRQDPTRTIRFDLAPFAGCTTSAGQLDLTFLKLPHPSSSFATLGSNLAALAVDLAAAHFDLRHKRYLVYYDGQTNDNDVCGTAFRDPSGAGGPQFIAAVWLRACGGDAGAGDIQAAAALHELVHSLGVLPRGAPHACPGDDGHPCDSPTDLMYPELSGHFDNLVLDVGRDDYYGHSGGWFDLQDSPWLMRADVPPSGLTVTLRSHSPQDRVRSEPVGVDCPAACALLFDTGVQVRLAASPGSKSRFVGWAGGCTGTAPTCAVTMDAAKTVEARFGPATFRLSLVVTGKGRAVVPALGLVCTRRCNATIDADAVVRVRAAPAQGWRFVRWTGACTGRGACNVRATANSTVGATFRKG